MIDHPLAASAVLSSVAAIVYSYLFKSYGESEWVELLALKKTLYLGCYGYSLRQYAEISIHMLVCSRHSK